VIKIKAAWLRSFVITAPGFGSVGVVLAGVKAAAGGLWPALTQAAGAAFLSFA
jgi:hypothetical protein